MKNLLPNLVPSSFILRDTVGKTPAEVAAEFALKLQQASALVEWERNERAKVVDNKGPIIPGSPGNKDHAAYLLHQNEVTKTLKALRESLASPPPTIVREFSDPRTPGNTPGQTFQQFMPVQQNPIPYVMPVMTDPFINQNEQGVDLSLVSGNKADYRGSLLNQPVELTSGNPFGDYGWDSYLEVSEWEDGERHAAPITHAHDCSCADCDHSPRDEDFWEKPNKRTGQIARSRLLDVRFGPLERDVHGETNLGTLPFSVTISPETSEGRGAVSLAHELVHVMDKLYKLNLTHEQVHALGIFLTTEVVPVFKALEDKFGITV